ncbi:MAG: L-seryl-tRNA(Sec) selenium transferase [Armatimonadetes bacterium]|nr:L-seryl-tRNA(Sec) selenium transferase [Armatimonadota bacterium]
MSDPPADPKQALLRGLPSVNDMLALEQLTQARAEAGHSLTVKAIRRVLERGREEIASGTRHEALSPEELAGMVLKALAAGARPACRHVINGTGVIIHTGLGRAVLPEAALQAIAQEARGYCLLEADRETGRRSHRDEAVARLLCELTGAEAATVVNNNAAATLLCLRALANGREVVVSRGHLVEIGGSFRIPEIMAESGARLREVGATNKTRIADYEAAITEETALLLRVHPSNFKMVGFTEQASLSELVELGRRHRLPVMDDIGSGALIDLSRYGLPDEPTAPASLSAGADLVCASADKLLGGCQGGVILGRQDLIAHLRRSPLYRALRVDKLTLIVLETTLRLYLDPDTLMEANPTLRMIAEPLEACARRAARIARAIRQNAPHASVVIAASRAQIGSGSAPGETLPTKVVSVRIPGLSADELARRLRLAEPPIFTRIRDDRVVIDAKTVLHGEAAAIGEAFGRVERAP